MGLCITGSSLTFSAQGERGKEKNQKPTAKNFGSPSEGEAEGEGVGGIPPRPSETRSEATNQLWWTWGESNSHLRIANAMFCH